VTGEGVVDRQRVEAEHRRDPSHLLGVGLMEPHPEEVAGLRAVPQPVQVEGVRLNRLALALPVAGAVDDHDRLGGVRTASA
jgi:hypothetical protein